MENPVIIILVIAVLIGGVYLLVLRKKKKKGEPLPPGAAQTDNDPLVERKIKEMIAKTSTGTWEEVKTSDGGVVVYSAVKIPDIALKALEEAAKLRIAVIERKFPHWTKGLTLPEWSFWLFDPDGIAPESQMPFLLVGGVMSAGTIAQGSSPRVVLPHYGTIGWTRISDLFGAALAEGEHYTEYLNDPKGRFLEFVGFNDKHYHDEPTAEEWAGVSTDIMPQVRGLASVKRLPALKCGFEHQQ